MLLLCTIVGRQVFNFVLCVSNNIRMVERRDAPSRSNRSLQLYRQLLIRRCNINHRKWMGKDIPRQGL